MWQLRACPSLIVHSTAVSFGTGSAPGNARHTGQVRVFGSPPKPDSQPQNIFVCVLSCTWISRPITGSQSGMEELLRPEQRHFDVATYFEDREVFLQQAVHANEAELSFPRFERQPNVVDLHGPRAVQHSRRHAEHSLDCGDEVGGSIDDCLHRSRSGTVS